MGSLRSRKVSRDVANVSLDPNRWVLMQQVFTAREPAEPSEVTAPPKELGLDAFYTKYVSAGGLPVVGSAKVSDFALREAASPSLHGPRVGLTTGKVLGKAVERNRIKRRLRDIVRRRVTIIEADLDIVLHPRKSVLTMDFAKLEGEVVRIFTTIQAAITKQGAAKGTESKVEL